MNTRRFAHALGLVIALLLPGVPAAEAGWVIVDDGGDQVLVSRGRLKMGSAKAGGIVVVLDVGRARMWAADPGRRVYWDGTVEEYCKAIRGTLSGAMADMDKQMEEATKNMSPAEREQVQQMMKRMMGSGGGAGGAPPKVTVERTADTATIAGQPTRKYRVFADGALYEEVWLSTDPALMRELEVGRAPETLGRMFACLGEAGAGGVKVEASAEYRQIYGQGWPLKAVYHGRGGGSGHSAVTRVEQREFPDSEFTPPAGFRPAPFAEVLGGGR